MLVFLSIMLDPLVSHPPKLWPKPILKKHHGIMDHVSSKKLLLHPMAAALLQGFIDDDDGGEISWNEFQMLKGFQPPDRS